MGNGAISGAVIRDTMQQLLDRKGLLYWSASDRLEAFIEKTVKKKLEASNISTKTINNDKDLEEVKELLTVQPIFTDYWFIEIDLAKFINAKTGGKFLKNLSFMIKNSTTMFFMIKSNNYKEYKALQEVLMKDKIKEYIHYIYCGGIYGYLFDREFEYLQTSIVTDAKNRLSPKLAKYVAKNYGNDVNAMFELFDHLNEGVKVDKPSKIIELIGLGSNTVPNFVNRLLANPPTTEKGTLTVISNRTKELHQLLEDYSSRDLVKRMNYLLEDYIDIKGLIVSGRLSRSISETRDAQIKDKYKKYQRMFNRIKELPLSRLLRLKAHISKEIEYESPEMLRFLYSYYFDYISAEVVPTLKKKEKETKLEEAIKEEQEKANAEKIEQDENTQREKELAKYVKAYGITEGRKKYAKDKREGTNTLVNDIATGKVVIHSQPTLSAKEKQLQHAEELTKANYMKKYGFKAGIKKFEEDKANGTLVLVETKSTESLEKQADRLLQQQDNIEKIKDYKRRRGLI